jgi:hypothetical protein
MDKYFIQKSINVDLFFCLNIFNQFTTKNFYEESIEYYFSQFFESKHPLFVNDLIGDNPYEEGENITSRLSRTKILKFIFNENCTATLFHTNHLFEAAASKEIDSGCAIFMKEQSDSLSEEYTKTICYQYIRYHYYSFLYIIEGVAKNKKEIQPDINTIGFIWLTHDMLKKYGMYGKNTYAHQFIKDVSETIYYLCEYLKDKDDLGYLSILVDTKRRCAYSYQYVNEYGITPESLKETFEDYIRLGGNQKFKDEYLSLLKNNYLGNEQLYKSALSLVSHYYQGKVAFKDLQEFIK